MKECKPSKDQSVNSKRPKHHGVLWPKDQSQLPKASRSSRAHQRLISLPELNQESHRHIEQTDALNELPVHRSEQLVYARQSNGRAWFLNNHFSSRFHTSSSSHRVQGEGEREKESEREMSVWCMSMAVLCGRSVYQTTLKLITATESSDWRRRRASSVRYCRFDIPSLFTLFMPSLLIPPLHTLSLYPHFSYPLFILSLYILSSYPLLIPSPYTLTSHTLSLYSLSLLFTLSLSSQAASPVHSIDNECRHDNKCEIDCQTKNAVSLPVSRHFNHTHQPSGLLRMLTFDGLCVFPRAKVVQRLSNSELQRGTLEERERERGSKRRFTP